MPQPTGPVHPTGTAIGRRTLLAGLAATAGLVGLTACSSGAPTGDSTPGGVPTSGRGRSGSGGASGPASGPTSTPPIANAAAAITTETRLCAEAEGILARSGDQAPSGRQRTILTQIRDAHLDHLRALHADPRLPTHPGTPAAPKAARVTGDLGDAIDRLVSLESAAARQHRSHLGAAEADAALVWASLATAAESYWAALQSGRSRSSTPLGKTRPSLVEQTPVQALSALLAQVDACLYGYQTAVPKLSGDAATTALDRITGYYQFRDSLSAQIVALKGTPPAAAPAYVLSPRPTDASSAGRLIAGMETRIQPFLGRWVAASTGAERSRAASTLTSTARVALDWGAALNRWPGWA